MPNSNPRHWVSLLMDGSGQVEKVRHELKRGQLCSQIKSLHSIYASFSDAGGDVILVVNEADFMLLRNELITSASLTQNEPFAFIDISGDRVYKSRVTEKGFIDVYIKLKGELSIPSYIRTKGVSRQDIILINSVIDFLEKAITKKGVKDGLRHCRMRWRLDKIM